MNDVSNRELAASSVAEPSAADTPATERKRHVWVWLRRSAIVLGAVALFVAAAMFIQRFAQVPTLASDDSDSVAEQWLKTIGRLGIDAIYPPQEDVLVGDIIIKVSADNEPKPSQRHEGRSVHVARLDMTKELQQAYGSGYIFPETSPKPQADGAVWQQQPAAASIFAPGAERRHLPLLLLPGFTVARVRQASAGGGWLSKAFSAVGAVEGEGQSTLELKIPMAESYGVPFLVAKQRLDDFCKGDASRGVCTQDGARDALVSNVGTDVLERVACPKPEKGKAPEPCDPATRDRRLDVEILLVYRVFMTRSIETVTRASSSFGAQAKAAVKIGEELRQLQAAAPPAPGSNASPAEISAARVALDAHKARVDALMAQVSSSPGATASLHSADSSSVSITQTLQRPVVIGYRTVMRFPEDPR